VSGLRLFAFVCLSFTAGIALAAEPAKEPAGIKRLVAVDNVCAWPNLTVLPDGTITSVIFNKPSHGQMEGQVECWASRDGEKWELRGRPAPNDPHTNRMNVAVGLAGNGDLLVLCSGWTDVKQPSRPKQGVFRDDILRTWVCRSTDGGKTWSQLKEFVAPDTGWTEYIPFGDIVVGADKALHVSCYGGEWVDPTVSTKTKGYRAWHFRSDDDGKTWKRTAVIGPRHNETTLLHVKGKEWLATSRVEAVEIFRSVDDGDSWELLQRVTGRNEINADLTRLADGRLLLTYGNRVKDQFGVLAKLSSDEGQTWTDPIRLLNSFESDCGYPSTIQRADGKLVSAYYTKRAAESEKYHMGVAIWDAPQAK
jgi:Neuraminidase (sialidase)